MVDSTSAGFERALAAARQHHGKREWAAAHAAFIDADQAGSLLGEDIELLAQTAYLLGREDECVQHLERAHQAYLSQGLSLRAARSAFWLGLTLMFAGRVGPAMGWYARARRVLDTESTDCVERGYLLLPEVEKHIHEGDLEQALRCATTALECGEQFGDRDLVATARHFQARLKFLLGELEEGLALMDETMIAVTSGELSPRIAGLVYCSLIAVCQKVYEVERARDWTQALSRWCDEQPELLAFTGRCMVHRAEVLVSFGEWPDAIAEAEKARERFERAGDRRAQGSALYRRGEVYRLLGSLSEAERIFEVAGELGYDPQPGLALLRLAQGRVEQAAATVDRVLSGIDDPLERTEALRAGVEIHLGAGHVDSAERYCEELERSAARLPTDVMQAIASHARGAIQLAKGNAREALLALKKASERWRRSRAPYAEARARCLMGMACRDLNDADGARLEFGAARAAFERLGAQTDLGRVQELMGARRSPPTVLSTRELEVLRLVATGKTSKAIATELNLSVKTIDRHLSNVFAKLNVSSRAEATAYAYQHGLA